jgi:hypothetical protein
VFATVFHACHPRCDDANERKCVVRAREKIRDPTADSSALETAKRALSANFGAVAAQDAPAVVSAVHATTVQLLMPNSVLSATRKSASPADVRDDAQAFL